MILIGQKVRLIHTGEIANVVFIGLNDLVQVKLQDGTQIPVFMEDISVELTPPRSSKSRSGMDSLSGKKASFKPPGVQSIIIIFEQAKSDESLLEVFLWNQGKVEFLFRFDSDGIHVVSNNGLISPGDYLYIGTMEYADISDQPNIQLSIKYIKTDQKEGYNRASITLRPKSFVKKMFTHSNSDRRAFAVPVDLPLKSTSSKPQISSKPAGKVAYPSNKNQMRKSRLEILHSIENSIDLHFEKLHGGTSKMTNHQKLSLQLQKLDKYIYTAFEGGLSMVFIIHGEGSGKLKSEVANRLNGYSFVESFKNEYHPNYGYGATEVKFKKSHFY